MRTFLILLILIVFAGCRQPVEKKLAGKIYYKEPHKTFCYQVQNNENFLGYADKYELESQSGIKGEYYLVYSPTRELIGCVQWNGRTLLYEGEKTSELGSVTLSKGLEKIFNSRPIMIYPVRAENVVATHMPKDKAVNKQTKKEQLKEQKVPSSEEENIKEEEFEFDDEGAEDENFEF